MNRLARRVETLRSGMVEDAYIDYRLAKRRARAAHTSIGAHDLDALDAEIYSAAFAYRARVDRIRSASALGIIARAAVGRILRERQA